MNKDQLLTACAHFPDGREFEDILTAGFVLLPTLREDLASAFHTLRSAPGRWASGRDRPNKDLQKKVVDFISNSLNEGTP